ncbi:MAG: sensor signal transduction histidine kinase [Flavipsychrobacter sp.]|jgi:signal transduction histidine kinase|nr:sensor signal transduction histidine kinase [Flavipsychrobacter sp.]
MNQTKIITKKTGYGLLPDASYFDKFPAYNPGLVAIVRSSDLKVFYVNDAFEYYLGYSNDYLKDIGLSFAEVVEEHQRDHLLNQFNNVKESIAARSAFVIYQLRNQKKITTPFYLYASPILDNSIAEGDLFYILMHPDLSKWGMPFISFDSKDLFLEQFKSEHFGTFEWIIDEDKIYCSPGVYQIYEIDPHNHEITNFLAKEFVHPNDKQRVREETKLALEGNVELNIEYRIITAKQKIKTIHCLARAIKNRDGKAIKYAGSIRDVTEQRYIEEDLKRKVEELYNSNKELEEFAYVASHDLQEPLRKITTFSDRLSEKYKDVLTGDGAMYLTRMIASAENMRSLINDLLEFSRVSKAGQKFETVDLDTILAQVKTDLELTIEETGTVINSQPLPKVEAVASQMKQLFANIINNAIKFRKPDTSPVITIECTLASKEEKLKHEVNPGDIYYKIQIADNGIGFESEYATRIFQVFQRLHGKAEYPGSGIGLAICKKILEHHKGTIYAENIHDIGARFTFILPEHLPATKGKE